MEVVTSAEADHDFERLSVTLQGRVLAVFERLEKWPRVSGVKALTGPWKGYLRIRTGDYRVVFAVSGEEIVVVRIAHRRDVYD